MYKDNSQDWLYLAKTDLEAAKKLFEAEIYHLVCFHSQQTIEKCLKAMIRKLGGIIPKTHSLAKVFATVRNLQSTIDLDEEEILFVDQFYVPSRYPDALPGGLPEGLPDRDDALKALQIAESVYRHVTSL